MISENPLKISDGIAEIEVTGVSGTIGDTLVVTGDWGGKRIVC